MEEEEGEEETEDLADRNQGHEDAAVSCCCAVTRILAQVHRLPSPQQRCCYAKAAR